MTTFDKREKAEESKYAHDEQLLFKATARRDKLIGLWLAEKFGLAGSEADAYAKELVIANLSEAGDEDLVRKIMADIAKRGIDLSEHRLRAKLVEVMEEAKKQIMSE